MLFRSILQVFEVGTATMMASKGAVIPVGKIMKDAGEKFDPGAYIGAVAGYYTAPNARFCAQRVAYSAPPRRARRVDGSRFRGRKTRCSCREFPGGGRSWGGTGRC